MRQSPTTLWWMAAPAGALLLAASLTLAGCRGLPQSTGQGVTVAPAPATLPATAQQQAQPSITVVRVIATEFKFNPSALQVPSSRPVTLILDNQGTIQHDLTGQVGGVNVHLVANAGQTARGEFTFDKPGEYELICSIPGHKEAGMKAKLVVGAGASPAQAAPAGQPSGQAPQPKAIPAGTTRLPLPQVAPPIARTAPATVNVDLEVKETTALMADGIAYTFWTFGGTVPGPMIRVRQGDTVDLTLKNPPASLVTHSIDLHAVIGPGGGAKLTQTEPGKQTSFSFKALHQGVYVYHCATPMVAHHIASGMYGLIVVEPPEGLARVDREYYLMQGDFYLQEDRTTQGLHDFSMGKMLDEKADYVLFNGSVGALTKDGALKARVGETVRIFFGVGGPNLSSSFHVIGEVFDRLYRGDFQSPLKDVQTATVAPGEGIMVEFKTAVPGSYTIVDHSLGRLEKGAAGVLEVEGPANPEVFKQRGVGGAS